MKNIILILSIAVGTILFAGPPPPPKAPKVKEVKYDCINSDNEEFEITVKKSKPMVLIVDGDTVVVQDMGTLVMFNAIIEEKATGTYKGEKYYTIGIAPNQVNCSRK